MREIHYYVHGRGRGHATRALSVVPSLQQAGYRIRLFAGEAAKEVLGAVLDCSPIRSLLPGEPFLTGPKFIQRTLWASARGLRDAPLCVVSDGDMPSSIASSAMGVPVIAIGHGLVFSHALAPEGIDRAAWSREACKAARASCGSDYQVPVNFCPLQLKGPSVRLARARVSRSGRLPGRRGGVVCYFRDANCGPVLEALRSVGLTPRLFTAADPLLAGVVWEPPDREKFVAALREADAVVSSAGHQLISECLQLRVPHLVLYREADDEQRLNAQLLELSGLGQGIAIEQLDRSSILRFLEHLPSLERRRRSHDPWRALPALDDVLLDLLAHLETIRLVSREGSR